MARLDASCYTKWIRGQVFLQVGHRPPLHRRLHLLVSPSRFHSYGIHERWQWQLPVAMLSQSKCLGAILAGHRRLLLRRHIRETGSRILGLLACRSHDGSRMLHERQRIVARWRQGGVVGRVRSIYFRGCAASIRIGKL